jgi:hypothetical protein
MPERFRYRKSTQELVIGGDVVPSNDGSNWVAPMNLVADGSLASLTRAFMDDWHQWHHDHGESLPYVEGGYDDWGMKAAVGGLRVSMAPIDEFDDEYSERESFELGYLPHLGAPIIDVILGVHGTDLAEDEFGPLLEPALGQMGAVFIEAAQVGAGTQGYAKIRVAVARRGATVRDAKTISDAVEALLSRLGQGPFDAESGFGLVRAGRADLLIGMTESDWLECKSQAPPIDTDAGRIELAQDVARFANSDAPALLVIGPVTKRRGGHDTITSIKASPLKYDTGRFHRAVDQRVFPPIDGLVIENATVGAADGNDGYVMVIFIPAQVEELKPFLVHGAIVAGKVEGAFISIVRRRGEDTIPVRPESIHATLAAGRALLRGHKP